MSDGTTQRDLSLDIMRFVGLTLIILAHVSPPDLLFQFRTFDVPLMIFVSGMTLYEKKLPTFPFFVKKRLIRLCAPVWIFLTFYFICHFILSKTGFFDFFSIREILESYLFLNGIGYVWIIRVFLLIMFITPILVFINNKCKKMFALIMVSLIVLQDCFVRIYNLIDIPVIFRFFFWEYFLFMFGYAPHFLLGLRIRSLSRRNIFLLVLMSIVAFMLVNFVLLTDGIAFNIQKYKYPPQILFTVYGIMGCLCIYLLKPIWEKLTKIRLFVFIGQNTIWIYLWHIFVLLILSKIMLCWAVKFLVVYTIAVLLFFFQYNITQRLVKSEKIKRFFVG